MRSYVVRGFSLVRGHDPRLGSGQALKGRTTVSGTTGTNSPLHLLERTRVRLQLCSARLLPAAQLWQAG